MQHGLGADTPAEIKLHGTLYTFNRLARDTEGNFMKSNIRAALLTSVFALAPLTSSIPSEARTTVAIDFGNVAVGYRDGYRDQRQHYHHWARKDADSYRAQHSENYRDMNHDRDHH
jgi:hypothetical protein